MIQDLWRMFVNNQDGMEGNGRATIWLDVLFKNRIQKCVDLKINDYTVVFYCFEKDCVICVRNLSAIGVNA